MQSGGSEIGDKSAAHSSGQPIKVAATWMLAAGHTLSLPLSLSLLSENSFKFSSAREIGEKDKVDSKGLANFGPA